jgi:hypothetical protein
MSELNPNSDPALADRLRQAAEPYRAQLAEISGPWSAETVERIYDLGVAAGVAMMGAQVEHERGATPDVTATEQVHSGRAWELGEGLKLIDGVPVATSQDMKEYEMTILGKNLRTATVGIKLFNAISRVQNNPPDICLSPAAAMVRETVRFYDEKELVWRPQDILPRYVDLLSMVDAAKALQDEWRGRKNYETGFRQFSVGSIRFLTAYLNHALQLDPPLESH